MSDFERGVEQQWRARMISQLKDAVRDLKLVKAENAKLREENRRIGLITYELGRKSLAQENAELRELVRDMWREGAFEAGACCFADISRVEKRTRELGIEIDR